MNNLKLSITNLYFITFFTLNLAISACVSLSYDESYYWIYSKFLSFGYYDHPPMVAFLIKLGTLLGDTELGVRFYFNVLATASLWMMWNLSNKTKPIFFILLSLSLPLIQAAGFLALPDTPLLFFSILFLWFTKKYLDEDNLKNSFWISVSIASMFYSKYHGLLVVLLTVGAMPTLLKRKSFWVIVVSVIILYFPHIYWQYQHDFVTFDFHLNGRDEKHFELKNIMDYIGSQIAIFGISFFLLLLIWIKKINIRDHFERILTFNIFGFLIILFFMSFRNQIEANWTVTACAFFLILMTLIAEKLNLKLRSKILISIIPVTLLLVFRIILILPDSFYKGKEIGRLNEVKHWDERIKTLSSHTKGLPIVSETYQYGAKISFELKKLIPVEHFRGRDSHYRLLNLTKGMDRDQPIYYLTPRKQKNGVRIETGYKDPIYIIKTTLNKLNKKHRKK
jgi:4-amino-4-deoxy-L-arabinose transferase-like glycosyltransferase